MNTPLFRNCFVSVFSPCHGLICIISNAQPPHLQYNDRPIHWGPVCKYTVFADAVESKSGVPGAFIKTSSQYSIDFPYTEIYEWNKHVMNESYWADHIDFNARDTEDMLVELLFQTLCEISMSFHNP